MGIGTALAIGGSAILGGIMSSRATSKAASSAQAAQQSGIDAQLQMFYKSLEQYEPFYKAGVNALGDLQKAPSGAEAPMLPSPKINFEFDSNDETYKIRQEDLNKGINKQLAARGLYNSRPGLNLLADQQRRLQSEEIQNQYGRAVDQYSREYTSGMDQFNIQNALAQQNLGKYQDLVKLGAGAAGSMGQNAMNTGQGVASSYNAMTQPIMAQGQAQAGMWQDIGSMPVNMLAGYYYGNKAGLWG